MTNKATIACAVTGSIHTSSMSPYLPITQDQIAAKAAPAKAGAAMIHLHARDPRTGKPRSALCARTTACRFWRPVSQMPFDTLGHSRRQRSSRPGRPPPFWQGKLATSNAEQVTKIRRVLDELSLEIATPAEACAILDTKGDGSVAF
jgi:uncharacterized protein (DUF849 family)